MRGLIITNLYPNSGRPTRATFNFQQFEHLGQYCELLILVPVFPNDWKQINRKPVSKLSKHNNVHYLKVPTIPKLGKILNAKILAWTIFLFKKSLVKNFSPNFILGCFAYPDGVAASLISSKFKLPCFMKVHGTDINVMGEIGPIKQQISNELLKISGVFSVSEALARNVVKMGCPEEKISVIYNGIDHAKFYPKSRNDSRTRLGLDKEELIILFIGNLLESKGAVDLIEAFIKSKIKANLLYIGTGNAKERINKLAKKRNSGQSVRIIEPQNHDLIPDWLATCNLLALPSHNEGVPNVVLEAMACGRPTVASNVGGIPEILPIDSGILVEKGDLGGLAKALINGINNNWDPKVISANTKRFNWTTNASQINKVICDQINPVIKINP
jgi:glycosyltransferase involved in cell wall biosynthesis